MFGFFRKKRPENEPEQGSSITVKQFIELTLSMHSRSKDDSQEEFKITLETKLISPVIATLNYRQETL